MENTMKALKTLALVLATMGAANAQAGVVTYNDFSDITGLTRVGAAAQENTADGTVMRLTPNVTGKNGAMYSSNSFTLGQNATFSTTFKFRMSHTGFPADGLAFVLAASPNGLGGAGAGMGYQGVPNSVIVEFDTYNNGWWDGYSNNQVGLNTNGDIVTASPSYVYGQQTCVASAKAAGCLSNGNIWTATIGYDGTKMSVVLRDEAMNVDFVALQDHVIDISSILGTNQAYAGFTAATGAWSEAHDILSWTLADTAVIPTDLPEPGSVWMLGLGMLGLGAGMRLAKRRS
jgi:hypothetical protein